MPQELSEVVLILVGSTFIILLLITLIILALFINQKRKFRHNQELALLKYSYEQEVLKTQLETQMLTFETISQELHDNVGILISMALVHLNSGNANQDNHHQEMNKLLDEAMDILRDISRSINPDNIRKRGLEQSIANELRRLKRTKKFSTEFSCEGKEFDIGPEKQIIFFRIVQEALNNIIKHSHGDKISLALKFQPPYINLSIRDNGRGFVFTSETTDFPNKSGLINMRKRAKMINADLSIGSELDKGTCITLSYPWKSSEKNIP